MNEPMRTRILDRDAMPLSRDDVLVARLSALRTPVGNEHPPIRLGLEGPQGELYRLIETSSLVEAIRVFETLREFGLRAGGRGRDAAKQPLTRVVSVAG